MPTTLYVSPLGRDDWSGRLCSPAADGSDGPLASVKAARDRVRAGGPSTVQIRGGHYYLDEPLTFTPQDSGPITYAAYPGEVPTLDGGVRVTDWHDETVNGTTAWVADVSALLAKHGPWKSLFVGGARKSRSRLPKAGYYWMEDVPGFDFDAELFEGTDRFVCREGDVKSWRNLTDVEILASHYWVEERMPIASFNEETRLVTCSHTSIFNLEDSWSQRWSKYAVENVFEAMSEPGEWYLDRGSEKLYYVPEAGQTPDSTEVVVPILLQVIRVCGEPDGEAVTGLTFSGLRIQHTDWVQTTGWGRWFDPYKPESEWRTRDSYKHFMACTSPETNYATVPQGAFNVPGAIHIEWATGVTVERCEVRHIGFYGACLGEGCQGNRIAGNRFSDMGAGGVILDGGDVGSPSPRHNCHNTIEDNTISDGGWAFASAAGIISVHGYRQTISHNEIHDMGYSGVSCGWIWGYAENVSRGNVIEYNHIYNLGGRGGLSDMGGVYLLGVQPGTMVRCNLIHHVTKSAYGGWGLYPDEGSSFITFEGNIIHHTNDQAIHEHWGRQNIYRNNILAFPGGESVATFAEEDHDLDVAYPPQGCTFERNIVLTRGAAVFNDGEDYLGKGLIACDMNLYWDIEAKGETAIWRLSQAHSMLSLSDARAKGLDRASVVADPGFTDALGGDFSLPPDSPAFAIGFRNIDLSAVGPRA